MNALNGFEMIRIISYFLTSIDQYFFKNLAKTNTKPGSKPNVPTSLVFIHKIR